MRVKRRSERFASDDSRVITRLFIPGDPARIKSVIGRVLRLDADAVAGLLDQVIQSFASRHRHLAAIFRANYEVVTKYADVDEIDEDRRLLIGAYFTKEYSFESAALFNPSIVPHPDQEGVPASSVRFLMSLRATGEGHVSSIVFRSGMVGASGETSFDAISPFARSLEPLRDHPFEKQDYFLKLIEMGGYTNDAGNVLDQLGARFTFHELECVLHAMSAAHPHPEAFNETAANMRGLAKSNYVLELPTDSSPSEIVMFPVTENESGGMEDMRLVRFVGDDGEVFYYGTYTAYNGYRILPQLMQTREFRYVEITSLQGKSAYNKGQAIFPRKVDGWYVMISRQDGENLYLMRSKNVRFWNEQEKIQVPTYPWEFVQIGNCGSPIEVPEGWLLLTHGVGPMRRYCIGATLLDLKDPSRVIGQTPSPILAPTEDERDGYVPNVVYSCGAIIHNEQLIIPYAVADSETSVATVPVEDVLKSLVPPPGTIKKT